MNVKRLVACVFVGTGVTGMALGSGAAHADVCELLPSDGTAGDWFGWSVATNGTTAIVGAYRDDDNGEDSGSAYLFDVATGQQIAKLLPYDGAANDRFGYSVAISGTTSCLLSRR